MTEEIRIISLELENYRPYYGKHKINFSSREEGFTVIFGKNGEGKSNLLNAISWCLYREEPHGMGNDETSHKSKNKSLPILIKIQQMLLRTNLLQALVCIYY